MKLVKNQLYYEEILSGERESDGSKEDLDKIELLKNSNSDILNEYSSKDFATSVYFAVREKRKKVKNTLMSLCCVFLIGVIGFNLDFDSVRMKGGDSSLMIYKKEDGLTKVVEEADRFKSGDILQITYFTANWKYGSIISLDGDGVATLHYPSTFNDEGLLINNTEAVLPYSYELDNAKEYEKFYFLVSDKSFDVKDAYDHIYSGKLDDLESKEIKVVDIVEIKKD